LDENFEYHIKRPRKRRKRKVIFKLKQWITRLFTIHRY